MMNPFGQIGNRAFALMMMSGFMAASPALAHPGHGAAGAYLAFWGGYVSDTLPSGSAPEAVSAGYWRKAFYSTCRPVPLMTSEPAIVTNPNAFAHKWQQLARYPGKCNGTLDLISPNRSNWAFFPNACVPARRGPRWHGD